MLNRKKLSALLQVAKYIHIVSLYNLLCIVKYICCVAAAIQHAFHFPPSPFDYLYLFRLANKKSTAYLQSQSISSQSMAPSTPATATAAPAAAAGAATAAASANSHQLLPSECSLACLGAEAARAAYLFVALFASTPTAN